MGSRNTCKSRNNYKSFKLTKSHIVLLVSLTKLNNMIILIAFYLRVKFSFSSNLKYVLKQHFRVSDLLQGSLPVHLQSALQRKIARSGTFVIKPGTFKSYRKPCFSKGTGSRLLSLTVKTEKKKPVESIEINHCCYNFVTKSHIS